MADIRFGTDGWRDVISDGFTFQNLHLVIQAIADYLNDEVIRADSDVQPEVVIGYDTRFLSDLYAREAARIIAANGLRVRLTDRQTPSPVVSYAVRAWGAAAGIMITASHNPPRYNGVKLKGRYGGSALPAETEAVERKLRQNAVAGRRPVLTDYDQAVARGSITLFDPRPGYFDRLAALVDVTAIREARLRVAFDPMYGAAQGYLRDFLRNGETEVVEVRGEINPAFGGVNPEPIEKNLSALVTTVREGGCVAGFATDGDGDRVGAVDAQGEFVDSHRIFALLVQHLAGRKGWPGGIVKTFSTTSMIDILAARYGRPLTVTPVGFKHICRLMLDEEVLIGGEESGGIGICRHIPERDGILCSLYLMEVMAVTGKPLHVLVSELLAEVGPHYYCREDLSLSPAVKEALLRRLREDPPRRIGSDRVRQVETLDGFKYTLEGNGWLLFRPSGTEPVVRIYAEAATPEKARRLVKAGEELARQAGTGPVAGREVNPCRDAPETGTMVARTRSG